jgi:hypothetical protein
MRPTRDHESNDMTVSSIDNPGSIPTGKFGATLSPLLDERSFFGREQRLGFGESKRPSFAAGERCLRSP